MIDAPLNDAQWLNEQFTAIRALASEPERLGKIDRILNWTDPGPGGFYDNLGDATNHPHLVPGKSYADDPAFLQTPFIGIGGGPRAETQLAQPPRVFRGGQGGPVAPGSPAGARNSAGSAAAGGAPGGFRGGAGAQAVKRISSSRFAQTLHEQPLEMLYQNLDKTVPYTLRVVYGGESYGSTQIRLVANGTYEIQPLGRKLIQSEPLEFKIPPEATAGGELRLTWTGAPGLGGDGRGVQVAEVWLAPVQPVVANPMRNRREQ